MRTDGRVGLTNALLFVFTRHAFIQRMTRPPGIRITTHKLTVTTEADNLVRLKTVALDEYAESVATPRQLTDSVHYTVTFDDGANWARPESNASEQGVAKSYAL